MRVYTVTEFRKEMNDLMGQVTVVVQGEISDFNISQNRFVWFSLSDEKTVVKCFMLAFKLRLPLENGMEVRLVGSPTLFKKGQMVFQPRQVELIGDGSLQKAFEALKKQLEKEGLFDEDRKRSIPRIPQRIGLVTSSDAAAYTDVLRILNNRWSGLDIRHIHVNVQGANAVNSIAGALAELNEEHQDLDLIILTRGGGSLEDLQAFNEEEVCRAIFASKIPVVSGVGHERDITLADLVADVRASTPSNAAERVVPDKVDVLAEIAHMGERMEYRLRDQVQSQQRRIGEAFDQMDRHARRTVRFFGELEQRLRFAFERFQGKVEIQRTTIDRSIHLLRSVHPDHLLQRGYAMVMNEQGEVISSVQRLSKGDRMITRFGDGSVESTVDSAGDTKKRKA